ncbi:MAG: Rpn family recombination-promoting nuclease/putative transposase [Bacteroidales bacterium]|uniref:Rpn family recombination-promoting nuclease/putative transposase n=1 Tax=Candidatus Cryptobacteroides bacterium TaxID=3085639 RepID=UPI002EB42E19|nr:Rpn family recombination-promoting nuclease/putative transposase [Bacteroidales bacterium]
MYFNEKRQGLAPFVNLRSDVGFKAVFADRNNKDILIGVLNQILPPEARIEDIKEYSDREQRRDVPYGKKTVLDLVCVDRDDRTFVVEMQASEEDFFFERCVYYASGLYHLELSDGVRYKGLRPVYVVSFLNYRLRHDDESLWDTDHFISHWRFTEKRTGMVADQTISVIFVEMTLFTKTLEECVTEFDRLFYIFKNSDGFQRIPEWIEEAGGISRRLAEACEVAAFDKEKKLKYEIDKMNEWDIQAQKEYAVRKGLEEGLQKGLREGREEGLEQGREETRLSIARKLFEAGTPVDVIVNCTGVDDGTIASFAHPE